MWQEDYLLWTRSQHTEKSNINSKDKTVPACQVKLAKWLFTEKKYDFSMLQSNYIPKCTTIYLFFLLIIYFNNKLIWYTITIVTLNYINCLIYLSIVYSEIALLLPVVNTYSFCSIQITTSHHLQWRLCRLHKT